MLGSNQRPPPCKGGKCGLWALPVVQKSPLSKLHSHIVCSYLFTPVRGALVYRLVYTTFGREKSLTHGPETIVRRKKRRKGTGELDDDPDALHVAHEHTSITKAPCGGEKAGRSPVDRGKRGIKRSVVVDGKGIPLGSVSAPANRHDSPLLAPTLDAARALGLVAEGASVRLDRGYDSDLTRERLLERGLVAEISRKGRPAPLNASGRWIVERTNAWQNAHKKLVWCTERRDAVIDFWLALSEVIIIVRRLVREGWIRYRWEGRPRRRP